jgi:hypothetical protein
VALILAGCGFFAPSDIPIGGEREAITRENLVAARAGMPGGLLEPSWLPDGFVLVHADYLESGLRIESVDLVYQGDATYLHIWQARIDAEDFGADDPVALGGPLEGLDWNIYRLPVANAGRPGVTQYSRRLDDGRTVTIDTDLDDASMRRVLEGLVFRAAADS